MVANPDKTSHVAFWNQGHSGVRNIVESGLSATKTLYAQDSSQLYLFDRAAGITYTLPAASIGLRYKFVVTVTITSNSAKVITAGASFLIGAILVDDGGTVTAYSGDGTANVAVTQNGTTTGGVQGSWLEFECLTTGLWAVKGTIIASGTAATPFANS